jgi:RNA polymerase sigma-70 factor (sigma-E family)
VSPEDRTEFHGYVAARSGALLRTAYLLTGSRTDAEDLLQTALAKTYLAWPRISDRGALDGYVRRVMINTRTSRWRLRRVSELPTADLPERASSDSLAGADLHDALWRALATLSPRQRAAIVLRYYEDLTEAETAATLGISVGTVKSTVSRALTNLRDRASELGLRDDPRIDLVPATGETS